MRTPAVYLADDIKTWSTQRMLAPGCWSLARPMSWSSFDLRTRFKLAWRVFTGRYDALVWDERAAPGEGE
jgi:hypothetical protein